MSFQRGPETPPVPFIGGTKLSGPLDDVGLTSAVKGGLMGWLAPRAIISPGEDFIFYNAWDEIVEVDPAESYSAQGVVDGQPLATPSIRMVERETGADVLFRNGAFSIAWGKASPIAYFQGLVPNYLANQPYTGHIMAQGSLAGAPVVWTTDPGSYIVYGWADDTLIAYQEHEGEQFDVLALDGAGAIRLLAANSFVVAISPDGQQILTADAEGSGVYLLDVATGAQLAMLDLSTVAGYSTMDATDWAAYAGSWVGGRAAAETGLGIAILDVGPTSITFDQTLNLIPVPFSIGVHEPQLSADGSRVRAWAPVEIGTEMQYVYLDCELATQVCTEGPLISSITYSQAYNPSRPI